LEKLYIPCNLKEGGRVRINVKTLKLVALITLIVVICVSLGAGYVQAANEATITNTLSKYSVAPGESINVSVQIQSNVDVDLQILSIGIHGDWMDADQFLGANLAENPVTLSANGVYSGSFIVTIPSSVSLGSHTYYIGVDAEDDSSNYYSLDSSESTLQVVESTTSTSPTTNPSGSSGQTGSPTDYIVYIAVIAIVVMVVLALLVLLMLRKRARARTTPQPISSPPQQAPQPEQQPPPKEKPSSGENFDI
jgi:hypothetical protein